MKGSESVELRFDLDGCLGCRCDAPCVGEGYRVGGEAADAGEVGAGLGENLGHERRSYGWQPTSHCPWHACAQATVST